MKLVLTVIFFSQFLFYFYSSQEYHYPFGYETRNLNWIDEGFFDELEKDLGRSITFNNTCSEYSYIQHLKNKYVFHFFGRPRAELNEEEYYLQLHETIIKFPTQTNGYYWLVRFYMEKGKIDKAIDILKRASLEYNIPPGTFSHLTKFFADNDEFISKYSDLADYYFAAETTVLPDSHWIALYDSIKQQDQMYRSKYRSKDPRFELQLQIDEQNALFLRELVREYGWFSKFLGRNYNLVHLPVMHFSIDHQLYFLDYIIADCKSYQARWLEAEEVLVKMINHTTRIVVDDESYHSLPLFTFNPSTGFIDLEQSMLTIRSVVLAMFNSGREMRDIWLISTSVLSETNFIESLEVIKKYLALLGLDEDKIHIKKELLEKDIEKQLKLKTSVVLKLKV